MDYVARRRERQRNQRFGWIILAAGVLSGVVAGVGSAMFLAAAVGALVVVNIRFVG